MREIRRVLLATTIAALAICQAGCIVFFRKEEVPGVDPEARSFAFVDQVRGKTLILHDGGSVTLAPLAAAGMSAYQCDRLARTLKGMAPYPDPAPREGKAYQGLLVRKSVEPEEVLLSVPYVDRIHFCGLRAINLFPIRIKVPTTHADVVELVLRAGTAKLDPEAVPDPDRRGRYVEAERSAKALGLGVWASPGEQLLEAVEVGDAAEVERLLQAGAPADYVGREFPKSDAVPWLTGPPFVRLWSTGGYRHQGETPLMVAIKWQRPEVARTLLRHGADVNLAVRDAERPWTKPVRALHYAAHVDLPRPDGRLPMLKMLVEAGADVPTADAEGRLIVFPMFYGGEWDVIDYLRSKGASTEAFDGRKHGSHLLAGAAAAGNVSDMKRLIEFGADVNGLSQLGQYPLSVAAGAGHVEAARLLLQAGADPNRKDAKGRTPLKHARRRRKNESMVALLRQYGAS